MNILSSFFERYTVIVTVKGSPWEALPLSAAMSRRDAEKALEYLESSKLHWWRWWSESDRHLSVVPYLGEEHSYAIANNDNFGLYNEFVNLFLEEERKKWLPDNAASVRSVAEDYANLLEFNPDLMARGEGGSLHPTDRWLKMCRDTLKRTEWILDISPSKEEEYQTAIGLRESLTKILGDRQ